MKILDFNILDTWIPPSDIDGVDAKPNILSEVENIEFGNGFIENTIKVTSQPLSLYIQQQIDYGFNEILDVKVFTHSRLGEKVLYILWSDTDGLVFIIDDNTIEGFALANSNKIILEKPTNISYNLVNDQLKINLNVYGKYTDISEEPVLLNLSLVWLEDDVIYHNDVKRSKGWYLFPRWLGWNYKTVNISGLAGGTLDPILDEFISDARPYGSINLGGWQHITTGGGYLLANGTAGNLKFFELSPVTKIEIAYYIYNYNINPDPYFPGGVLTITQYSEDNIILKEITIYCVQTETREIILEPNCDHIVMDYMESGWYDNNSGTSFYTSCRLQSIKYYFRQAVPESSSGVVIAKYFDGQRGLIQTIIPQSMNITLYIKPAEIDYRVVSYEIYKKYLDIEQMVKVAEYPVDGNWILENGMLKKQIEGQYSAETVENKYNLPPTTRVDNQRQILSEVTHKGRVYFVNGDNKVYQSHISSNLAILSDSFPYDEEQAFGFFIVDLTKKNIHLAISPTNDLMIFTTRGLYIYTILPTSNSIFKQLKVVSGDISLANSKSITTELNGNSSFDAIIWADVSGIYLYEGGSKPPVNLILRHNLMNYWNNLDTDMIKNTVGFYYPQKKEYYLQLSYAETLVYDVAFDKFKIYSDFNIYRYAGLLNNHPYWIDKDYNIVHYVYHYSANRNLFKLATHSVTAGTMELYDKILQEFYIFGEGGSVEVYLIIDEKKVIAIGNFNLDGVVKRCLLPIMRFNRVKIVIFSDNNSHIKIRSFGIVYTEDPYAPLGSAQISIPEEGYGFNYGYNYGN